MLGPSGVDQYVQAAHRNYLNFPEGDFTISFWASLNAPAKTQYFIGKDMGQGNTDKWIMHYGPDAGGTNPLGPSILLGTAPAASLLYVPSTFGRPDAGTWHHYVFRKSGTNLMINFDDFAISGGSGPLTMPSGNTAPLTIGQCEGVGHVDGSMDEIRIYNRPLLGDEVAGLHQYESEPQIILVKAVKPSFAKLIVGRNYILQVSTDLVVWTNQGKAFTATNSTMDYPQYWDVENWGNLYFRLWRLPF